MHRRPFSRRQFLTGAAGAAAGVGLGAVVGGRAAWGQTPPVLGSGTHRYEWVPNWVQLPAGQVDIGATHGGMTIDASERLYFSTDTTSPVMILNTAGRVLSAWGGTTGTTYAGGLHGMLLVRQCDVEVLYITHTARHEVVKTTLGGQVLMTLPFPSTAGLYTSMTQYMPTGAALGPNGDLYVVDGYGLNYVHRYDAAGSYLSSFGGTGTTPGKFRTCHGILLDTRRNPPVLLIADRENLRLQFFDLNGTFLSMVTGFLRPCGAHLQGTDLVIPELGGRVTILDANNTVITRLGTQTNTALQANFNADKNQWQDGVFIAPHSARWDDDGNLYVMDWNIRGRVSKLRRLR